MSTITIKQDTLDSILTRLAALETDNDRLRTGMHNFNVDRNEADERIEDLKSRCDDLEVDNAELHEKNVELRESLASVESEVDAMPMWEEKNTELEDQVERLHDQVVVERFSHEAVEKRWKCAYHNIKARMDLASGQAARAPRKILGKKTPPPVAPRKKMGLEELADEADHIIDGLALLTAKRAWNVAKLNSSTNERMAERTQREWKRFTETQSDHSQRLSTLERIYLPTATVESVAE